MLFAFGFPGRERCGKKVGSLLRMRDRSKSVFGVWTESRWRMNSVAAGIVFATLAVTAGEAVSAQCKPNHFRAPYFIKTMGPCGFDQTIMSFRGEPAEQAKCLMRGMDQSRNLAPPVESLPPALTERVGSELGLPSREALSTFLSRRDLEWDFAAYLWMPVSRANNNDPSAPLARYFVIHDTSGPNYGHRSFPEDVDGGSKINNLAEFKCSDGWGKAHVVINRSGSMLLNHELSIPWRETKFEQAANFAGALKGLFLHVELIQPRRAAAGHRNDAASPTPAFTTAQYDRLALVYVAASVRAGRWLIPAFHAALDANIPNGHDDPLNFDIESFAKSLDAVVNKLQGADEVQASRPAIDAPSDMIAGIAGIGPAETANAGKSETKSEREPPRREIAAEHCQTRFVKGHRRHVCWTDAAETGARGSHAHAVRSMDRRVSGQGARSRHRG